MHVFHFSNQGSVHCSLFADPLLRKGSKGYWRYSFFFSVSVSFGVIPFCLFCTDCSYSSGNPVFLFQREQTVPADNLHLGTFQSFVLTWTFCTVYMFRIDDQIVLNRGFGTVPSTCSELMIKLFWTEVLELFRLHVPNWWSNCSEQRFWNCSIYMFRIDDQIVLNRGFGTNHSCISCGSLVEIVQWFMDLL